MNEMDSWETQLKSWVPRRPSAKLDRELFGSPVARPPLVRPFGLLAPAMCLLFTVIFFKQQDQMPYLPTSEHEAIIAMSLSNQSYAAYLPGSFKGDQNRWDTFEWTKGGEFTSSIRPLPQGKK